MKVFFSRRLVVGAVLMIILASLAIPCSGQTSATNKTTAGGSVGVNNPTARAEAVVVFPFENTGHVGQMDWMGEGLSELAVERLSGHGPNVLSREERLAALEKLGLPAYSQVSRATMLKIAGEVDADYVVFGEFQPDGQTVQVTARILRVNPPKLSAPLTESGQLDSVADVQARVSWRVLCMVQNSLNSTAACEISSGGAQQFLQGAIKVRPDALEFFVRGLHSPDDEGRLRDLRQASKLDPDWDEPIFSIAQTYYLRRDCESALGWFDRVPPSSSHMAEAGFDTGVCQLLRNDPLRAESTFSSVAMRSGARANAAAATGESAGIQSNLGTALLRQARYKEAAVDFERAEKIDPGEPDYWFNVGLAHYLMGEWEGAIQALREVARLQPDSSDAKNLLVAALDHHGNSEEANALRNEVAATGATSGTRELQPKQDVAKLSPTALAKMARVRMSMNSGAVR
jgi:tetratricopeptide (TPR) repeat protein